MLTALPMEYSVPKWQYQAGVAINQQPVSKLSLRHHTATACNPATHLRNIYIVIIVDSSCPHSPSLQFALATHSEGFALKCCF